MKGSCILRIVVVTLSVYHSLSADGCGSSMGSPGERSVRCGEECTDFQGYCTCGENAEKFDYRDNTTWCCNASQCDRIGYDIVCKKGTPIPLTSSCQGECNTGRSFYAGRQYWRCDSKDQCIKIQHVQDKVHHCRDRSDERKTSKDPSPIRWDKLTTCYLNNNSYMPGVKCSGQGLEDDCMRYDEWCTELTVLKCSELGGRTSVHKEVCSNNTHWMNLPCTALDKSMYTYEGKRCNSEYSGQCYYPDRDNDEWWLRKTCRDGSHDISAMSKNGSCPSTYFLCQVDGKESCISHHLLCDMHPQCDCGEDEKDCKDVYKAKRLTKPSGTRICHHVHYGPNNVINKPEVEIYALSCDGGEPECAGGVDEMCDPLLTRLQLCE